MRDPNNAYIQSFIIEHPKTSIALPNTINYEAFIY